MKTIKIKVYNEVHATWIKMMLEREIEEVKGTIDNEVMYGMNVRNLIEYKNELESALLEVEDA